MTDSTGSAERSGGATSALGVFLADGRGGATRVPGDDPSTAPPESGWIWVHLDRKEPAHRRWLEEADGIVPLLRSALLEEETRPRHVVHGDGLMLILRGVNLNPGAEPDDMISLRLLIDARRVVSIRGRRLLAIVDVRDALESGSGPRDTGEFLVAILRRLLARQSTVIDALADEVDEMEDRVLEAGNRELRSTISALRSKGIGLRRYLSPQRDLLGRLSHERLPWLSEERRAELRELAEQQLRLVEELDAARDRAALAHEELMGRMSDQMNRNMYLLSLVAGLFLPLGLLTGLLGINVGGIPGTEYPYAFVIVCVLLGFLAALVLWLFRRYRMI